jgi:AraC-like DNA-binding protein
VDWSIIFGTDPPRPRVMDRAAPETLACLLAVFDEILPLEDPDAILRRAVELARTRIGLQRVGIFLLDRGRDLMLGTWGSDLHGAVVDEHHIMYAVGEIEREAFRRAAAEGGHFTVFDGCPIVEHREGETRVRGRGWVACTPIRSSRAPLGMLFNDTGPAGPPLDPVKQGQAAILCALLGAVLDPIRGLSGLGAGRAATSTSQRVASAAVAMLGEDPGMCGKEIAARLEVSPGRLARVFKSEMGLSLVEYRNRVRLDHFNSLLEGGHTNLLEAALAAGFGSYAQFHRVFRSLRRMAPREYLQRRA